jgi:hypothetical protein
MKKITFLFAFLLTAVLGFAQQVIVQDFDTPTSFTFAGFQGLGGAAIVADPAPGGTRMNGLQLVSVSTGNPWQGAEVVQQTTDLKLTTDKTVNIDVYATQAFTLLAKVEAGTGPNSAASQSYTTPNAWQTLTFTFTQSLDGTGVANGTYNKIVFFPNWKATNDGFNTPPANFTLHIDNITAEASPIMPPAQPATAAPTPPAREAAEVKSIFSDAYTPIAILNYAGVDGQPSNDNTFNTSWCPATTSLVSIEGNNTNRVAGLGCEGISFLSGRFDATTFTHFHMDIWTETPTMDKSFNVKFSNWNNGGAEANAIEFSVTNANFLTNPNPGTWISLDIPLANFTPINGANRNDLVQFVISSDLGTVFYDNLYLHKNTVLGVSDFEASKIKVYPNPASTNLTIEAQKMVEKVAVYNMLGQEVISLTANSELVNLDISALQKGVYTIKAQVEGQIKTTRVIKQ